MQIQGVNLARTGTTDGNIQMAALDTVKTVTGAATPTSKTVERLVAWAAQSPAAQSPAAQSPAAQSPAAQSPAAPLPRSIGFEEALNELERARATGFDRLLRDHRRAWAQLWGDAEVIIEGDSQSELASRFAVFQLLGSASTAGEAAVGARGLTGEAYAGHVFWDADVFVLPALAAIHPGAARAMLQYRLSRIPAARAEARKRHMQGARFPWESAGDGSDVTPRQVKGANGETVVINTGTHEEHIVADVAWAADHYSRWAGDTDFSNGPGRQLMIETARYWMSRVRCDSDGTGHYFGVMGPDEYHEIVDDNAYTNVMARWNLKMAAHELIGSDTSAKCVPESVEAESMSDLAGRITDGWSTDRGIYEQFAGYFDLEPLLIADIAPPPVAADMLLGAGRVCGSQLIKQADVLMLHHMVPSEVVPGSLERCLDFYGPRTAHGSSLSPAVHASLLARAGQPDRALDMFRIAALLDFNDLTGTTSGGIHLATMGGIWQALAFGFLGLSEDNGALAIDPKLPGKWSKLSLSFRFRGARVQVSAGHEHVEVSCDIPILLAIQGKRHECIPPRASFDLSAHAVAQAERTAP
jgi:trehalose/maltose hydrolase-like predicted phosphorylase